MKRIVLVLGVSALFAAGFSAALAAGPAAKKPPCKPKTAKKCEVKAKKPTTTAKTTTAPAQPTPKGGFPAGIYFERPTPGAPDSGTIKLLGGSIPAIAVSGNSGFDVGQVLVWASGSTLHVVSPSGSDRVLVIDGLYEIRRPSLSPDGKQIVVQATQTPQQGEANDEWQTVYVIDLATGSWRLLAGTGSLPYDGNDLPVWLPSGNEIAYESTEVKDAQNCVVVNIADATTGAVKRTLRRDGTSGCETPISVWYESPRMHIAFSPDAKKLLLVGTLQLFDAQSGAAIGSVRDKALAGLQAAGYVPDNRYPPRTGDSPFALAGSFSPDGTKIVFDGSVRKDNAYYQLVMQINVDGSDFKIVAGPFEADEPFVSGNALSLLSVVWKY
ncbi:MAG: TolB family protein [Gaiellaceae bacterium]